MFENALLVDDDKITNFLHKRLVEKLGVAKKVQIAIDGEQAIGFLDTICEDAKEPVFVLLDLNMPGMNGFEMLETIRKHPLCNDLRIFVCTTSSNPRDIDFCNQHQIQGFYSKPLNEEKLRQIMSSMN